MPVILIFPPKTVLQTWFFLKQKCRQLYGYSPRVLLNSWKTQLFVLKQGVLDSSPQLPQAPLRKELSYQHQAFGPT